MNKLLCFINKSLFSCIYYRFFIFANLLKSDTLQLLAFLVEDIWSSWPSFQIIASYFQIHAHFRLPIWVIHFQMAVCFTTVWISISNENSNHTQHLLISKSPFKYHITTSKITISKCEPNGSIENQYRCP